MRDPEAIFAQLYTQLNAVSATLPAPYQWGLNTGRRVVHWDKVGPEAQPCMFMQQLSPDPLRVLQGASKWTFRARVWIYFRVDNTPDQGVIPDQQVNAYVLAIGQALEGIILGEHQTLGGLVDDCYIEKCLVDPGIEDNQAVIALDIAMTTGI